MTLATWAGCNLLGTVARNETSTHALYLCICVPVYEVREKTNVNARFVVKFVALVTNIALFAAEMSFTDESPGDLRYSFWTQMGAGHALPHR